MQSENLTCQNCNVVWQRPISRGRKPKFCPSCLDQMMQGAISIKPVLTPVDTYTISQSQIEDIQSSQEQKNLSLKYSGRNKWTCPSCHISLETFIGMDTEPMHKCEKRARKWSALERVSK